MDPENHDDDRRADYARRSELERRLVRIENKLDSRVVGKDVYESDQKLTAQALISEQMQRQRWEADVREDIAEIKGSITAVADRLEREGKEREQRLLQQVSRVDNAVTWALRVAVTTLLGIVAQAIFLLLQRGG